LPVLLLDMLPKNAHLWAPPLVQQLRRPDLTSRITDVYFCLADHYEPGWHHADLTLQRERVRAWIDRYPSLASRHSDSHGRPPQHTFFFPEEEYAAEHIDALACLCRKGWGDVEVHLHHDRDSSAGFREKLLGFIETLHQRHGLLRRDAASKIIYAFIHGNYALNNAFPNGEWCGVDDETSILLETGCYADLTMPSAPEPTQSRKINSIYYAAPQPAPRAHDKGINARASRIPPPGLLMIQGPLCLNWIDRKWGILPHIETADLAWHSVPTHARIRLWIAQHIHVEGAPEHVFVKVSTHGAQDRNIESLLTDGLDRTWAYLEDLCKRRNYRLHYVTTYEMFHKIRELESPSASLTPTP
jgi:hypothetical protein